jgi:hypothetical protein
MQSDDTHQDPPGDGDEPAYQVGYGKPPKPTRFRPGQSGNKTGRRKGLRNLKTEVKRTLMKPVKVKEDGGTRTISTQEGVLLKLREKALRGNDRALDRLIYLARLDNDAEEPAQTLCPEDQAILDSYIAEKIAEATRPTLAEPPDGQSANFDPEESSK